jgi:hypothetical protein
MPTEILLTTRTRPESSFVILPVIGGLVGDTSDVLTAGPCQSKLGVFGRGFASGALGTLSGIGVTSATGNLFLAGAAAGAVSLIGQEAGNDVVGGAGQAATSSRGCGFQ